ncbi:MAG: ribH1 [Variovorax sp.]|nr:ribH1 [Variovorax sp.]
MSQINDLPLSTPPAPGSSGPARVAFVEAQWHSDIVHQARDAFLAEMERQGFPQERIDVIDVPGAFEIPLQAKRLALSGRYGAIVACALVVDGGIYRHEFVAGTVVGALMSLQLETGVPVLSAVLTPHHFHEHAEHRKYFHRHFAVKGTEAADACVKTLAGLRRIDAMLAASPAASTRPAGQSEPWR